MLKLLVWSSLLTIAWSACDVCQTRSSIACHSEQKFSLCIDGAPSYAYVHCPGDYVCTDEPRICVPPAQAAPNCLAAKSNSRCGICSPPNRVFACINETTIAFCFGFDAPDLGALARCPAKTVCDLENESSFCSPEDQAEPSCSGESNPAPPTEQPTTPSTPRDPTTFCRDQAERGSYKPDGDTTCTRFVLCYEIGGVVYGMYSDCERGHYFHEVNQLCLKTKPANCN